MSEKRLLWIDSLRALSMIFVIYGHMVPSFWQYLLFTSPVKIPLFFAISGYLFKTENITFDQKLKKLAITILIPYFFLSLFPFKLIASFIPAMTMEPTDVLKLFFSGEYLWYLPCCFIAETIFFGIVKYLKNNSAIICAVIMITGIGLFLSRTGFDNFLFISNAMISQFFLLIGFEIKRNERLIDKAGWGIVICLLLIYIALGIISMVTMPGKCLSAHENRYYNIPLCFTMITTGCVALFLLFKKFHVRLKPLIFIGQNTLTYYAFNKYFRSPVLYIFSLFGITLQVNWFTGILFTIGCCLACWPISLLLNRFFPVSVGKRNIL